MEEGGREDGGGWGGNCGHNRSQENKTKRNGKFY